MRGYKTILGLRIIAVALEWDKLYNIKKLQHLITDINQGKKTGVSKLIIR
jgi:hypothetical protein